MHSFQNNLLLNTSLFSNVDKKKNNKSKATYVSIPVVLFGFEMYSSKVDEDFLTNAIIELYEYYNGCMCPNSVERVEEDLNLSHTFVKLVVKDYLDRIEEKNTYGDSDSEKKIISLKKKINIYLIYDLVTGRILPYILDDEGKEKFTFKNDEEHGIRLSIGKSEVYTPHRIKARFEAPYHLDAMIVSDFVREYYNYGKKARHTPTATGYCESFDMICACYYDKRNTTNYSIHHPFYNQRAKWLEDDIELALKSDYVFKSKMEAMISSVETRKLHENTQNNDFTQECEKALIKVYSEKINNYEAFKLQLIDLIMKYTVMMSHKKTSAEFERLEAAKHDYYITMYTTIEQLFGYCFGIVKNTEFYTAADVLINEILNQFIYVVSQNSNETNVSVVNKYLSKEASKTDIKNCIAKILSNYNNQTAVIGMYKPSNIRAKMYGEKMSTGNKLFYLIMLLDNNRPDILATLLFNNPKFVADVELWLKLRGHSEKFSVVNSETNSSVDIDNCTEQNGDGKLTNEQIEILKDRLLQTCDSICGYIFEIERKNRDG